MILKQNSKLRIFFEICNKYGYRSLDICNITDYEMKEGSLTKIPSFQDEYEDYYIDSSEFLLI